MTARVPGRLVVGVVALLSVTLGLASPAAAASLSPAARPRPSVTVTRDSDGIPHITAPDFVGLGFGEAVAFSQDNFCTLADDFVTVEGHRSRYFGSNGLSLNYSAGTSYSNLDSDLFWTAVKQTHPLRQLIHQPPPVGPLPEIRQVYRGFVKGYNAFLASGGLHDPRCAGKPWVHPINLQDMYLRGIQITTEASSQQFISSEVDANPPATPQADPPAPAPSPAALAQLKGELGKGSDPVQGSNGIGVGSQDTAAHDGMVLANPHFPWRGTERFWMAQLTVPGRYDVLGGTLEGFPLIGIGFNQNLAWTHTVSTDFRFTFYQLNLVPGDPTSYYVDGVPMKMGRVTARVRTDTGAVTHTFYTTIWGTVVSVPRANYLWGTTHAYAVDDATISDTFRAANQYLRMGQSTSVADLLGVESQYLAIPTFNTIAADDTGHALYADVGNTPNVPLSLIQSPCLPSGLPALVYAAAGVVTLDGSRSACAWQNDPGTPVPGIFNADHLPHTIRSDYVENSNDSYWLANPAAPFPAFSPIIGNINVPQDLRTRLGNQMIARRVAGTDGFGPPGFTIPSLQQMWESDQSEEAQLVLTSLVTACNASPKATSTNGTVVDLHGACAALSSYDGTGSLDAKGGWLFSEWYSFAPSNLWTTPFDPAHPLTTPSGLDTSKPAVLTALADAVLNLQANGVPLDASYRQVQFYSAANGDRVPIHGCDTGCFNAIYASDGTGGPLSAAPYGVVIDGSSLVMTTELTANGPVSQGIVTYSQATDPTSPWASNMSKLYSQEQWVPLRFTPAQLAGDHGATTVTYSY